MNFISTTSRLLALLLLGFVSLAYSEEAAISTARWGMYADLIGTQKQAPGGYRLRWSWAQPGVEILEEWITPSSEKVSHTAHITLGSEPGQFRVKGVGGKIWNGTQQTDGSVVYIGEGLMKMPYGVQLTADGTYRYLEVKLRSGKVESVQPEAAARMSFMRFGEEVAPAASMRVASTGQPALAAATSDVANDASSQSPLPHSPSSADSLAKIWGPLAYLADSAWTSGQGHVYLDYFRWNADKTRVRGVLRSTEAEGFNWIIEFRPGPKPNTLTGEVSLGEVKRDVLFRFTDKGVVTSDWTRINAANCRFEVRYFAETYTSRVVAMQGSKPEFNPDTWTYQRLPLEEVDATYDRNRIWLANAQAEQARLAEEQKLRDLEAQAALQRAYAQMSYESAPVYDRDTGQLVHARGNESPRGADGTYIRGGSTYQPDILGAFQRGLSEGLAQSDARDAQAMEGIREAVRQGNAIYEAEQERLRLERQAAFERERALAAEREYQAQLAAQREDAARQARQAEEAAAAEQAHRAEQARYESVQASIQPTGGTSSSVSSVRPSQSSDCYLVDDHAKVAMGFSRASEAEARSDAMSRTKGCKLVGEMLCDSRDELLFNKNGTLVVEDGKVKRDGKSWDCRVSYFCGEQRQVCPPSKPASASRQ